MNNQKFKLVPPDHPVLRQVAELVDPRDIEKLKASIYWIHKLMNRLKGAGLAGPQLGDSRRWFSWGRGLAINPTILNHGDISVKNFERCLSFPGFEAPRERWLEVYVTYTDENGTAQEKRLYDVESVVFQHELDHLNGICIDQPQKA